ncbi:DUSAM domain-containing protein [Stigmatella aurantiaca]|uniref:DUSAM domain-containing protein n=1 Tax=Stigmatella aurantiaca TaxID=41 RepID=UPI000942A9E1|nr:DUSAM domain-containing protein [Stigmatella aurantiaca]
MSEASDWDDVRVLEIQLQRGQPLELTDVVIGLLRRAARQVALTDAESTQGLCSPSDAATLVKEIRRRIREGSRRLSRAIVEADRRKGVGDVQGARQIFVELLSVEAVPLYRQTAQTQLEALDD